MEVAPLSLSIARDWFRMALHGCFRLERWLSSSFLQGTRPRFASGTLMSLRTIPPFRAGMLCGRGRVFRTCASDNRAETLSASLLERAGAPSGSDIRVPSRVLSAAHATGRRGYTFRKRPQGVTRVLSAAKRGRAERPCDGCPCVGAEEVCSEPPQEQR